MLYTLTYKMFKSYALTIFFLTTHSGDHDMVVPYIGSEEWTRSLGYKIIDEWRPWLSNAQIAGYIINLKMYNCQNQAIVAHLLTMFCFANFRFIQGYDNNLTFLTIKVNLFTISILPICEI